METLDCKKCAYYAPKRDFGYRVVSATCLKHDQLPMSQAKKKCDGKEFVANYSKVHYTPADKGNTKEAMYAKSTWKPSDEQMKALNYVINLMASSERPTENDLYYNTLKSLREQLKKLKEE